MFKPHISPGHRPPATVDLRYGGMYITESISEPILFSGPLSQLSRTGQCVLHDIQMLYTVHNVVKYFLWTVSAESSYIICCFGVELIHLNSDDTIRTVFESQVGDEVGFTVDSRACVVLLERNKAFDEDWEARLLVVHAGRTIRTRELLQIREGRLVVRYRQIIGRCRFLLTA